MFGSILGKKKNNISVDDITLKVSKMNLTEMRSYVNNRLSDFKITPDGLAEIMRKLTEVDEKNSMTYLLLDDMDSKKKKAFDLALIIASSKHISVEVIEMLQEFIKIYEELITKYDLDFKEIYASRFLDAIELAIDNVNMQTELQRKQNILGK